MPPGYTLAAVQEIDESRADGGQAQRGDDRASHQLAEAVLTATSDLVVVADLEGRIVRTNPALNRRLGYGDEHLRGTPARALWIAGERNQAAQMMLRAATGVPVALEVTLQAADGALVMAEARCQVVRWADESQLLIVFRDLSVVHTAETVTEAQRDLAIALSATADLDTAVRLVIEATLRVAQMDCGGLYVFDDDGGLRLVHSHGLSDRFASAVGRLSKHSPQTQAVRKGKPIYFRYDDGSPTAESHDAVIEGLRTIAAIPLRHAGEVLGCLNVGSHEGHEVSPPRRKAVEAIASQFANALARIRLEDELNKASDRFRALVENASDVIALLRRDGTIAYVSPAIKRVLGYEPDDLVGTRACDLVHPDDLPRVEEAFDRLVVGESAVASARARLRARGGSYRVLEGQCQGNPDQPQGSELVVNASDVTALVEQSEAYARERDLVRGLLESSPLPITFTTLEGVVTDCNAAAWTEFGFPSRQDYIGCNVFDLIAPDDRARAMENLQRTLTHGLVRNVQYAMLLADGTAFPAEISAALIAGEDGRPIGFVGMTQNIQRRKRLEEELREAQKMETVGRLAGGVAHDFNNVLTIIKGFSSMTLASPDLGSRERRDVEGIRAAAARAEKLVKQLMVFSRRQVLQSKPVELNPLLLGMSEMLRSLLGEHIDLEMRIAPGGTIEADPQQIENLVVNLAANARDAMPSGGRFTLATDTATSNDEGTRQLRLSAVDSGTGMSEAVLEHVFEPFFTTKPAGEGTGLGLATVYRIVEQHHGRIQLSSQPGEGSRFDIYFPLAEARPEPQETDDGKAAFAGSERILVVEDEDAVREVAVRTLQGLGYQVLQASCGTDALTLLRTLEHPPDLVVSDVVMPRMGGEQLAREIRVRWPGMPVLFMSGYATESLTEAREPSPGFWYIAKPFAPDQLARQVHAILASTRAKAKAPPES